MVEVARSQSCVSATRVEAAPAREALRFLASVTVDPRLFLRALLLLFHLSDASVRVNIQHGQWDAP